MDIRSLIFIKTCKKKKTIKNNNKKTKQKTWKGLLLSLLKGPKLFNKIGLTLDSGRQGAMICFYKGDDFHLMILNELRSQKLFIRVLTSRKQVNSSLVTFCIVPLVC